MTAPRMYRVMGDYYLFRENKYVGKLSVDRDTARFITPSSVSEPVINEIMNVYGTADVVGGHKVALREKYREAGYIVLAPEEIRDSPLRKQLEQREATPLQKREAAFIHESDLIEGIAEIPYEQILEALVKDRVGGHVGAWDYARALAEKRVPLKAEYVYDMQKSLANDQSQHKQHCLDPNYRGKLRDFPVSIGGKIKKPISEQEFADFFEGLNSKMASIPRSNLTAILKLAAQSHWEYEGIHPFADNNGRTGRLIVNYILAYFGYPPFVFTSNDKRDYYDCFQVEGINDVSKKMEKYFLGKYKSEITSC